eukprot:526352_1
MAACICHCGQLINIWYIKVSRYLNLSQCIDSIEPPLLSNDDEEEYCERQSQIQCTDNYTEEYNNIMDDDLSTNAPSHLYEQNQNNEEDIQFTPASTTFDINDTQIPFASNQSNSSSNASSSGKEFGTVANNIYASYNRPRSVFKSLHSISSNLLSSNTKYRSLDSSNPLEDIKYTMESTESAPIKEWLRLLGFHHQPDTGLLVCPHDEPPKSVIDTSQSICELWINKCNQSRSICRHIQKYSTYQSIHLSPTDILYQRSDIYKQTAPVSPTDILYQQSDVYAQVTAQPVQLLEERENESETTSLEDYPSADISDEDNQFRLQQLIWSVTHHKNTEHENIRDVLLLCMPVFTSPKEVLSYLKPRFLVREPEHTAQEHWEIQNRVVEFLQEWMTKYYYQDFHLDPSVEQLTEEFIDAMRCYFEAQNDTERGFQLLDMIESTMDEQNKELFEKGMIDASENRISKLTKILGPQMVNFESVKNPKEIERMAHKEFERFYSTDNQKIAQQLVLISFKHFRGIQPRECLEQNWKGVEKEQRAPNILKVIDQFNAISNYIQFTILKAPNANKRAKWITKWLKIGGVLLKCHDFQSLAAIHGALTSQPVYRQSIAWEKVHRKYRKQFDEIKVIFESRGGHCNLRKIHNETGLPMVPYAGVLLQMLFQIDEGNKDKNEDGSVNFGKLMRLHSAIQWITSLQDTSYEEVIQIDGKLQEFISHCVTKYAHITSEEIYQMSTETLNKDDPKRSRSPSRPLSTNKKTYNVHKLTNI